MKRYAFTLLELLVTMGIVGVLVGLLMAAVIAARHRSSGLECQTRLRGIGQLFQMYANENGGYAPVASYFGVTAYRNWLDQLVESGVGKNAWELGCPRWQSTGRRLNGYGMNPYAVAHRAWQIGSRTAGPRGTNMVAVIDERFPEVSGGYFKLQEWRGGGGAAGGGGGGGILCGDSTSDRFEVTSWSGRETETLPNRPEATAFTIDFTRHLGMRGKAGMSTPALNLLYADGRVELSSARDALRALGLVR